MISLDQIITIQVDEPHQKSCIYKTRVQPKKEGNSDEHEDVTKFSQIRVKSINFLEQDAIAIYFYDMTHHIEALSLEKKVQEQRRESTVNQQVCISKEFRNPLNTCLTFLQMMLTQSDPSG